jgi:hypothetical protein
MRTNTENSAYPIPTYCGSELQGQEMGESAHGYAGGAPQGEAPPAEDADPAEESTYVSGAEARLARIKTIAQDVADRSTELNDRLRRMTDPPELGFDVDNHDEPSDTNEPPTTHRPERSDEE